MQGGEMSIEVGARYPTSSESNIEELALGASGLRVVVYDSRNLEEEPLRIEYHFDVARGFLHLDEGDLLPYWKGTACAGGYHLFQITLGGWMGQELQIAGMLSVTEAVGTFREWFICTSNGCLNVLSVSPPLFREFG